jgi:hypothetical protein
VRLPQHLEDKANSFGEWRYGANRVDLILRDGRVIRDVKLAWGRDIDKVGSEPVTEGQPLGFSASDIADIVDRSDDL